MTQHGRVRAAVTVMAYPNISAKQGEVVCVAGIRMDTPRPEWIRLWPFQVRDAPVSLRIHKWDVIELETVQLTKDRRGESRQPRIDTMKILRRIDTGFDRAWEERRSLVDPLRADSLQALINAGRSLGALTPSEVLDLSMTRRSEADLAQDRLRAVADAAQLSLFEGTRIPLEPVPWEFHYIFRCEGETEPRRLKIVDWEINETWRKWRHEYDHPEDQIREQWLRLVDSDHEPALYVGNIHSLPHVWMCLGVFWPPRRRGQPSLALEM